MKLTHFAALLALIVLAAPAIADDADDTAHPFTEPKTAGDAHFVETFTSGMGSWIHASDDKYTGKTTVQEAKGTKDKGLYVDTAAQHYGVSAVLPKPADPSEGIVLQYEARLFGPDKCGGTNKVHVIFRHKSPLDGSIEEKHLMAPPSIVDDKKPQIGRAHV